MSEARYRIVFRIDDRLVTRDVLLDSDEPIADIMTWLDEEYDYRPKLKKVFLLRDDGVEEQIY